MDNIKYTRPGEIITSLAVITTTASVSSDPRYGLSSLFDGRPARPAILGPGPVEIIFDFNAATRIDGFALPNHNLAGGGVCTLQMNATNSWGSPTVDTTMTIGTDHTDGHRASPWKDFTTVAGYNPSGFRYLRFVTPAGAAQTKLGEILVLARLREFSQWALFGGKKGVHRRFLEAIETEYGVQRVHRRKIKQRTFAFDIKMSDQDWQDLNDLADDCSGLARPFFITADGSILTDGGLYARFTRESAAQLDATEEWYNVNPFNLSVKEVSRSLPL